MSPEGYRARLWLIEWHVNLWRAYGTSQDVCERALHYFQEVLDADFYGEPRPKINDSEILAAQRYFDDVFAATGTGIAHGREYQISYS